MEGGGSEGVGRINHRIRGKKILKKCEIEKEVAKKTK